MGRTSAQGRTNRVRAERTATGMTQAELAAAVGVTRQTVVAVEAGDYAPSVYLALAIAARLGNTVEALFDPDPATLPVQGDQPPSQRRTT
jgi:putative transcriptional regulator